jgi:hypothetical protein
MSEDQDLKRFKLRFSGASDRLEWLARPYLPAEWRNEGLTGTYLFELEAHPGWPQGRSVRITGSKPIPCSSGPDAAGPGLAHSFLMAQSPTLRRPRRPVPGTSSGTHAPTAGNPELNDDDNHHHAK